MANTSPYRLCVVKFIRTHYLIFSGLLLLTLLAPRICFAGAKDGQPDDWAADYIQDLIKSGSITGFDEDGDGKPDDYKPQEEMRRAEFMTVLARALKMEPANDAKISYKDITEKHWAYPYVAAVAGQELIPQEMVADGLFKPSEPVTRKEIAAILVNVLGKKEEVTNQPVGDLKKYSLKDMPFDAWSTPFIVVAIKNGIITGYQDKTFKPDKTVTRAEAFAMIVRTLKQIPEDVLLKLGIAQDTGLYTGLLIDCRGLEIEGGMSPQLLDEDGNVVYGNMELTEYLETVGVMGYYKSEDAAKERVGANPLVVTAIEVRGQGKVHIHPVVKNDDAKMILDENSKSKFLEKYRVAVLKD